MGRAAGRLRVAQRDERYLAVLGLVLDVLTAVDASVSGAATLLGLTTGNLVDFLQRDPELLTCVNRLRAANGLHTLGGS